MFNVYYNDIPRNFIEKTKICIRYAEVTAGHNLYVDDTNICDGKPIEVSHSREIRKKKRTICQYFCNSSIKFNLLLC